MSGVPRKSKWSAGGEGAPAALPWLPRRTWQQRPCRMPGRFEVAVDGGEPDVARCPFALLIGLGGADEHRSAAACDGATIRHRTGSPPACCSSTRPAPSPERMTRHASGHAGGGRARLHEFPAGGCGWQFLGDADPLPAPPGGGIGASRGDLEQPPGAGAAQAAAGRQRLRRPDLKRRAA